MLTPTEVQKLYKKYDVTASKRFGQNFLIDSHVLDKIVEASNIKGKDVMEIGPGLGSLTSSLLEDSKSVTSYEIDNDMIRVLKGEIHSEKFHLLEEDFLKAEFKWKKKRIMVANIPYNITSNILFKLFENSNKFESATLMMQKEVGDRILAKVGSKNYSKLTPTTQIFADTAKVIVVKPTSFIPAPKVTSIVIKFDFKNVSFAEQKPLIDFLKLCFTHRRKTLINNLKLKYTNNSIIKAIETLKKPLTLRPQELSLEEFKTMLNIVVKL